MDLKLEQQLFDKYPTIFPGGRKVDPMESLLCFGFECDDGWFSLIDELCSNLLKVDSKVEAVQVKEKMAGLRFYTNGSSEGAFQLIREAEEKSYSICETCGKEGAMREDLGYYKTLCSDCYHKKLEEIKKHMEKYYEKQSK